MFRPSCLLFLSLLCHLVIAADPTITSVTPDTGTSASDGITSATTLTISGTADVGASVVVLFDGTNPPTTIAAGPTVVDGTGTFTLNVVSGVTAYATRYVQVRSTLVADIRLSTVRTLVIDPQAVAPVITSVSPQGQSGFTNDTTPTFSGTADAGATVSVFSDGGLLGSTTANSTSGVWSFTPTSTMPDGAYVITAIQEDLAGNGPGPASANFALTIDSFHAGLTVLRSPSGLIANASPTFQGLCEIGATVTLRDGTVAGPVIGSVVNSADPWTLQPASALADGDYTAYVVSTDAAGNSVNAGPFTFTVDTTPPQNLVISGFLSAGGIVLPDGTTDDRTLQVFGTIALADAGSSISISIDGIGVASAIAGDNGVWRATLPSLRDATWSVAASASDAAGNSTTAPNASVTINAPDDTVAQRYTPVFRRALGGASSWTTSDNTPTLDGTAGPLRTVTLSAPQVGWPTPAPTVLSNVQHRWTWTPSAALPDGTYVVTATTSDGASIPFTVIIDSQAPSTVTFTAVTIDSGTSASDEITSDNTLVVSVGSVSDPVPSGGGLTVTAFIAGVSVGSGSVSGGNATIDLTGITLSESTHAFTFQARDAAGNVGPLSAITPVIVDGRTPAPLVLAVEPDTGRSSSDRLTQSSTGTVLRGRAEANAPVTVTLTPGGATTITTNGSGTWTLPLGALADGLYTTAITATDLAGNSASTNGETFTIDNTPPAVPTATITNDNGSSNSDRLTNDQTLMVSGAAEADSDVVVTLQLGATTHTRTVRATGGGTYSVDFTNVTLAEGTWALSVTATDAAGNTSTALNVTVTIDITLVAPTFTAIVDDTGRSNADFRTQDTTVTVSGTASIAVDVVSTVLTVNAVPYTVTGATWSQVLPALAENNYPMTAVTTDAAGNSRQANATLQIDLTSPTAAITAITVDSGVDAGDFITNDTTLVIGGTSNETDPDVLVEVLDGVSVVFSATVRAASSTWSADATATVLNGNPRHTYTIRATPTDAAGNVGSSVTRPLIIDTVVPSGAALISDLDVDSRTDGDLITNDNQPDFTGTYSAAGANEYVRLLIDDQQRAVVAVAAGAGAWSWVFSGTALSDGVHVAKVQMVDDAGNVANTSPDFTFTIDTVTPAPSAIIITTDSGIVPTDKVTNDPTLTISGSAEPLSDITVIIPGLANGVTTTLANGTWSLAMDLTALTDGTLACSAGALDIAGNTATANFTIILDRSAPAAPVVTAIVSDTGRSNSDRTTKDRGLLISGTAEAASYVDVYRDAVLLGRVQASGTGAWTFDASATNVPVGEYDTVYTATATDLAGNLSNTSAAFAVRIDTVAPPTTPAITGITNDSGTANDRITNDPTLFINGTADAGGTIQAYRVRVSINNTDLPWVTPNGAGVWSVDNTGTTLVDGTYTLSAISQDLAGNNSVTSPTIQVVIDTVAPPITLASVTVDTGASASDFVTSADPTTIRGATEGLATVTLSVTPNGGGATQQVVTTANAVGEWNATVTGLTWAEGAWDLSATAVDRAGNPAPAPATQLLIIDRTAPAAPVITGFTTDSAAADNITNDNTLVIAGTAEANALVRIRIDGTERGTTTANGAGAWTFAAPLLADGQHVVIATATDAAGNVSADSNTLTLTIDTVTSIPVLLAIAEDSAATGDFLTNDPTLILSGRAEASANVSVTLDGQVRVVTADGAGLWTADFTGHTLASAVFPVTMQATDVAGNVGNGTSSLTVDANAPAAPVIVSITDDTGASASDFITSDTTLVIQGTAEANSRVQVFVDGDPIFSTQADGGGAWSWDLRGTELSEGTYVLTAQATDAAGNSSALSAAQPVVIDTTAPFTVQILLFSEDTGRRGDRITSDRGLVLTGVTGSNATVTLRRDGSVVATVIAGPLGRFTSDQSATSLADGIYTFTASAVDTAGNVANSRPYSITVDGTAPAAPVLTGISVDSATVGDWITNDNRLIFSGTAEPHAVVSLLIGTQVVGTAPASPAGEWNYDLTGAVLPDGTYSVGAIATDAAGNVSPPATVRSLVIDTAAPGAPTPVVDPDTGDSASDRLTNADPAGLSGTGEPGALLSVFIDGRLVGTPTVSSTGTWSLTLSTLAVDGAYAVTTSQRDAAGNTSVLSSAITLTLDRSLTQPVLTSISVDSGLPTDFLTNDTTPTLTGRGDPLTRVIIRVDGVAVTTVTTDAGGVWTTTAAANWADGTYSITLLGEDPAGNAIGPGSSSTIILDATPPAAPVISGISDDTGVPADFLTSDQTLVVNGTAEAGGYLELAIAGVPLGITQVGSDGVWTFDATIVELPAGTFEITARAIDRAGNIGPIAARDVTIDYDLTVGGSPLDVAILGLTPATDSGTRFDRITNADPATLIGLTEGLAEVTVRLSPGGAILGTTNASALGIWTLPLAGLIEGTYQLEAIAEDLAGNTGDPSVVFILTIDRTTAVPVIAAITIDSYTAADFITNDTTVTISGTAEANARVTVSLAGSETGTATADGTGAWTLAVPALADGSYVLQAVATDVAGNSATDVSNRTLLIDTTLATPTFTQLVTDSNIAGDGVTNDGTPRFEGLTEANVEGNARIRLFIDGIEQAPDVIPAVGGTWATGDIAVADGIHEAVVRATDRAGNVRFSATRTFTIDTVMNPPVITLWTPDTGVPGDNITAVGAINLVGLGEADSTLVLNDNGTPIATLQVGPTGFWSWSFSSSPLPSGVHSLVATTTDLAGNSASSAPLSITVDTDAPLPPAIDRVVEAGGAVVAHDAGTRDPRPTVFGTSEANARVTVTVNGVDAGVVVANGAGEWSWIPTTNLLPGQVTFTALAIDAAGNRSLPSAPYVIFIIADARQVQVNGCGTGSFFALMMMAFAFLMLRARGATSGRALPLFALLVVGGGLGLQAEDRFSKEQKLNYSTRFGKESLNNEARRDADAATWEWGIRLLALPQPEDQGTELDGYGEVPTGDYDSVPSFGVFLRRSQPFGDGLWRWGIEGGISAFAFDGTSAAFDGSDAVYDYRCYDVPLEVRLRLDHALGEDWRIGIAAILASGVAYADISGTASAGGISQDIGDDTGVGLYTAYGAALDVAWTFDDAREWTVFLEVGYLRGRTSLDFTDEIIQGGQTVAEDQYNLRIDHVGMTYGLGVMSVW